MKRFFIALMIVLVPVFFISCTDEDETPDGDGTEQGGEDEDKNEPTMNEVTLTYSITSDDSREVEIIVSKIPLDEVLGSGSNGNEYSKQYDSLAIAFPKDLTIDWGDGTINNQTTHQYRKKGTYNVTVKATNLQMLVFYGYKAITSLNITKCKNLKYLNCGGNMRMTKLNTSGCVSLEYLNCWGYGVADLNLNISNCTKLKYLDCRDHNLTELDVSRCSKLEYLDCGRNNLTEIDISNCINLGDLICHNNNLNEVALNKIYRDLPENEEGRVNIGNNPSEGDMSIAEKKGWKFGHF